MLMSIVLSSCATKPITTKHTIVWGDSYGLIHLEKPEPGEILGVALVNKEPVGQCIRLRDFVYKGKPGDWTLKLEGAKQAASHMIVKRDNEGNTIGLPYDCNGGQKRRVKHWEKNNLKKYNAYKELIKRAKKKNDKVKVKEYTIGMEALQLPVEEHQYYKGFTKDNLPKYANINHGY